MSVCHLGCGNKLKPNSKLKTCQACRNSMGFWINKRTIAQRMAYQDKLKIRQKRMVNTVKSEDERYW